MTEKIENIPELNHSFWKNLIPIVLGILIFILIIPVKVKYFPFWFLWEPFIFLGFVFFIIYANLKSARRISYSFSKLDILFVVFLLWQLTSYFWAENSSLIYNKFFCWLNLYLLLKSIEPFKDEIIKSKVFFQILIFIQVFILALVSYHFFYGDSISNFGIEINEIRTLPRAFGINDNYISSLLVLFLPINLFYYKSKTSYFFFLFILYECFIIFSLNSRASTIALVVVLLYYIISYINKVSLKKIVGTIMVGVVLFIALIPNKLKFFKVFNPMRAIYSEGGEERLKLWGTSIEMMQERLFLGYGNGNWFINYYIFLEEPLFLSKQSRKVFGHVHNFFLETGAELGIIGLGLLLMIFFTFLKKAIVDRNFDLVILPIVFMILSCFYGVVYFHFDILSIHSVIVFLFMWLNYSPSENITNFGNRWRNTLVLFIGMTLLTWFTYKLNKVQSYVSAIQEVKAKNFEHAQELFHESYSPWFIQFVGKNNINEKIATAALRNKKIEKAIKYMKLSLRENPSNWGNWNSLGKMYFQIKDYNNAIRCFRECIKLNNTYYNANLNMANLALEIKDEFLFEEAILFYEKDILPVRNLFVKPELWNDDTKEVVDFLNRYCSLEDKVIELLEKSQSIEFTTQK